MTDMERVHEAMWLVGKIVYWALQTGAGRSVGDRDPWAGDAPHELAPEALDELQRNISASLAFAGYEPTEAHHLLRRHAAAALERASRAIFADLERKRPRVGYQNAARAHTLAVDAHEAACKLVEFPAMDRPTLKP